MFIIKKYDVIALGELLIDFTQSGYSEQGNINFEANPGGAPCNVLAMLAKLGKKTAFIGKVGNDMFGRLLKDTITEAGIEAKGLVLGDDVNTTLAFVHTQADGDRDFSFFRKPGADTMLEKTEIDAPMLENCKIFHFGSLSLTHSPARQATEHAIDIAQKAGALISFDPNLRPLLWGSLETAREQIAWGCTKADILKIAEEELEFLTSQKTIPEGVAFLKKNYPQLKIIFVTKGKLGAECFYKDLHVSCPSFLNVVTIDTTGAGDTFCGSCLGFILEKGLENLDESNLLEMLCFANAAASLVTTKKGAIRSMPEKEEIQALMSAGF